MNISYLPINMTKKFKVNLSLVNCETPFLNKSQITSLSCLNINCLIIIIILKLYLPSTSNLPQVYLQSTYSLPPVYIQSTSSPPSVPLQTTYLQPTSNLTPVYLQSTSSLPLVYLQSTSSVPSVCLRAGLPSIYPHSPSNLPPVYLSHFSICVLSKTNTEAGCLVDFFTALYTFQSRPGSIQYK